MLDGLHTLEYNCIEKSTFVGLVFLLTPHNLIPQTEAVDCAYLF